MTILFPIGPETAQCLLLGGHVGKALALMSCTHYIRQIGWLAA
jgi:hypothetical protein